ncbi:MAG TPA: hypothetical protein VGR53_06170 [Nitrososphaerales archaeon]|nr:hypothetical protein [Nitrososphaerales archaeon]
MSAASAMTAADLYGFAALFLIALAAALMLLRSKLLKLTKNIALVRSVHLVLSAAGGLFLALHISAQFMPPVSTGILLGYSAVIVSVVAWLTGTAFLQKVKDSLFFHGVLSSILIPLSMMHVATSSTNLPANWPQILLVATAAVVFANAALHIKRAMSSVPR